MEYNRFLILGDEVPWLVEMRALLYQRRLKERDGKGEV
jgi:hypothetical protein